MLTRDDLSRILVGEVAGVADDQVIEAEGYDAIQEMLTTMRSISFPSIILEDQSSGVVQVVEGPLDTFTQSFWVMDRVARSETKSSIVRSMKELGKQILARLLKAKIEGEACLQDWEHIRTTYMRRDGGQNAAGWEMVLTFKENFTLEYAGPEQTGNDATLG